MPPYFERDPAESMWCLIGNIVEERPYGHGGAELKRGTKHFSPGTKVYCFPGQWGDGYEMIRVLGKHRGYKGGLVDMVIRSEWITNWRAKVVYRPAVLRRFAEYYDAPPWREDLVHTFVAEMERREEEIRARGPGSPEAPGASQT